MRRYLPGRRNTSKSRRCRHGFYGAIDMGANVYQNRGGDRVFTDQFGDTLTISPKNDVGFFGGIKLGYVIGSAESQRIND